jgi:hypothetical protein
MTAHKTQLERVKAKLERDGFVTRNECLSQFPAITRLGARICDLQEEGWTFSPENTGRDYVYRLVSKPTPLTIPLEV